MTERRLLLLFPGQGAQAVGMGRDLAERFPAAREVFRRADEALGFALSRTIFEGPAEALEPTDVQQPALLVASLAAGAALEASGAFAPGGRYARERWLAAGGLSLGEYTALAATEALTLEAAVRLVRRRGELMQQASRAVPSGMSAILGLERAAVEELCREAAAGGRTEVEREIRPANFLGPGNVVIAGELAALERAEGLARARGARRCLRLKVAGAFHTALMRPAAEGLAAALAETTFAPPAVPVLVGVTGRLSRAPEEIRAALLEQVARPLLWEEGLRAALAAGAGEFLELGPGRTLAGLIRRLAPDGPAASVSDLSSLAAALAPSSGAPAGN